MEYEAQLPAGTRIVKVKCLPSHRIHSDRGLRYAISVNADKPQIVNVHTKSKTKIWKKNVLRGYSIGETRHTVRQQVNSTIRIYLLDTGLALSRIEIF